MTNRITGTNSGIDVDTVVKQSLTTEQNKIDKAYQQQKVYEYQQQQLKEIVDDVQKFYDKYLDILSSDSLLKSSAYETVSFTTTDFSGSASNAVTAKGFAGADVSQYKVTVTQLAQKASATLVSQDVVSGNKIAIKMGDKIAAVDVKVSDGNVDMNETAKALNAELKKQGINATAKYSEFAKGIVIESGEMGKEVSFELSTNYNPASGAENKYTSYSGKNAEGTIVKGEQIYSIDKSSNVFTVDNIQFTLNSVTTGKNENVSDLVDSTTEYTNANGEKVVVSGNVTTIVAEDGTKTIIEKQENRTVITTTATSASGIERKKITVIDSEGNTTVAGSRSLNDLEVTGEYKNEDGSRVSIEQDGTKTITSKDGTTITTISADGTTKTESFDSVTLSGETDISGLKDTIVEFVNDYNKIMESINEKLWETRDKDYMPLTDEQKKEMSESEIESWEKKAQTGLLRNDSDLRRIQSAMKSAMSSMMSSTGLTLESIGIEPVDNYTTKNGMYKIDEDKLTNALQNNAEEVKDLFTRTSSTYKDENGKEVTDKGGVLTQLQSVLKSEFKSSSSSLSKRIGFDGTSTEKNNTLTNNISKQKSLITKLKEKYTDKENALYKKYSALEVMLEKLNAQTNSLYSMLGIS